MSHNVADPWAIFIAGDGTASIQTQGKQIAHVYDRTDAYLIASLPAILDLLKRTQVRIFLTDGYSDLYQEIDSLLMLWNKPNKEEPS